MKRIIPNTKKKTIFLLGLSGRDLLIIVIGFIFLVLVIASGLNQTLKIIFAVIVCATIVLSVVNFDVLKGYQLLYRLMNYITRRKKFARLDIKKELNMQISDVIKVNGIYSAVIELNGIDFSVLDEHNQDGKISLFNDVLKEVSNGKIIKLEKAIDFDKYIKMNDSFINEYTAKILYELEIKEKNQKIDDRETEIDYDELIIKLNELIKGNRGQYDEVSFMQVKNLLSNLSVLEMKKLILLMQNDFLEYRNDLDKIFQEAFYFVIQDGNLDNLQDTVNAVMYKFNDIGLCPERLEDTNEKKQLTGFLNRFYSPEKDINKHGEIILDNLHEKMTKIKIGSKLFRVVCCHNYKMFVDNAWGWELFRIPDTKVVFNFRRYSGKSIDKLINKSLIEIRSQLSDPKIKDTEAAKLRGDLAAIEWMMEELHYGNERLLDTEFYFIYPDEHHKKVLKQIRSVGITINDLYCSQYDGYLNTFPYLTMPMKQVETICHMPTHSIAGMFPFVIKQLADDKGFYIGGSSGLPAMWDVFFRGENRVNSNICVLGKTGGGKSFFLKLFVLLLSALDKKVFILDPDNEYKTICENMKGNFIDVSGTSSGRINPLQIFPAFRDSDSENETAINEVASHRIFLEQFFKTVLPDIDAYTLDLLSKYIQQLYKEKNINSNNVNSLRANDFPIFNDLLVLIKKQMKMVFSDEKTQEFEIKAHKILEVYIDKFAGDGLYSTLWNGHTTMILNNNFTVLNFQSLFSQSNNTVANAQMLLIMKFLNQEVIKNREKHSNNIVIVIDEAHRLINPDFPVGLTFMQQMAKQIRKYFGALVVATQNVDDFLGVSEKMRSLAAAVINSCQYNFIFGLLPDDTNKVKDLYKNYGGGFTKSEIDYITSSKQGDCLFSVDINTRLPLHITAFPGLECFFLDPKSKQVIEKTA